MQLGLMYLFGHGTPQNSEEGKYWIRQAAMQGLLAAQINLAALYSEGQLTERDITKAWAWLFIANAKTEAELELFRNLDSLIDEHSKTKAQQMAAEIRSKINQNKFSPRARKEKEYSLTDE